MLPFGSLRDIGGSVLGVGPRALSCVLFSTVVVLKAPPAFAQMEPTSPSSVTIGDTAFVPVFEVRSRGEFRGRPVDMGGSDAQGGVAPALDTVGVASSRVRVGLGAERGAFRGLISLQDARVWGGDGAEAWMRSTGAPAFTGVNEAYGEAHTGATRPAFVRFGRQRLKWGQGLLLGDADFSPTGRSLDAVRVMVPWGDVEGEFLLSMLDAPRPSGPGFQDGSGPRRVGSFLMGSRWAWAIDPLLRWELSWLTRWADASSKSFSSFQTARAAGDTHTASLRVSGSRDAWEYGVEGVFQFGRASGLGLSGKSRRAWAAVASVSYRFDRLYLQPTLSMGGAYASGDEQGDVYTQFDPVAPDVQGPFGVMDVFALSNLVEGHAAVGATLADDCQLTLRYGYARMADRRGEWLNAYLMPIGRVPMGGENTSPSDGELGHEMALAFQWALRPAFSLRAAYGLLLQGQGARAILASSQRTPLGDDGQPAGGASFSHGGYLQGLVRFP